MRDSWGVWYYPANPAEDGQGRGWGGEEFGAVEIERRGLHFVDRWTGSNRGLIVRGLIRQAGVPLSIRLTPAAQHTR